MAEESQGFERLAARGLSVAVDEATRVLTLRYFSAAGALSNRLRELTGTGFPDTLAATEVKSGDLVLAWRSPTETLCLTRDDACAARLATAFAGAADGCLVDLTGGLKVVRVAGTGGAELLCRLGGTASVPRPGEARRSRLADVPVVALALQIEEIRLVVDRSYLPHLLGWIRETLLDFAATP